MVQAMLEPDFYDHPVDQVELIQTHISWVFLTGEFAYKVKKPVNFGFLDFTSLAKRKFYCEEELRLNRRLAPQIYLGVIPITEQQNILQLNAVGHVVDYCVKMLQFSQACLIKTLLSKQELTLGHMKQLADAVAEFHSTIPHASSSQIFGSADEVIKPIRQNFATLRPIVTDRHDIDLLDTIEQQSLDNHSKLEPVFAQRKTGGYIRECHGDLHLGNIALVDEEILIFDCIEFNENFRWIDTMSEIAFLVMDLQDQQQYAFASHLLNRYLEKTGDFDGLAIIKFYMSYRAMVRAKVCGLQLQQLDKTSENWHKNLQAMRTYIQLAISYNKQETPFIVITHGISGSGKSWTSSRIADRTSAIHIRSDVERKRLYKNKPEQMYESDATIKTYKHLLALTKKIIKCNYPVIIDATFLKRQQRKMFEQLASEKHIPYHIILCEADDETIRQRLKRRSREIDNVSDATIEVMQQQSGHIEALDQQEKQFATNEEWITTTYNVSHNSLNDKTH